MILVALKHFFHDFPFRILPNAVGKLGNPQIFSADDFLSFSLAGKSTK